MVNLLQETIDAIHAAGQTPQDITFIGAPTTGHRCTWAEFESLANFEYDEDYGLQNVARDLVIVFADESRLERTDYDGSEAWVHVQPFAITDQVRPIKFLSKQGIGKHFYSQTLAELNP